MTTLANSDLQCLNQGTRLLGRHPWMVAGLGLLGAALSALAPFIQLRAGRSLVDLVPGGQAGGCNMDHFCLRVEPFDAASIRAHLVGHGVAPGEVVERSGADGVGPSMYIQDPEGNRVELKGP